VFNFIHNLSLRTLCNFFVHAGESVDKQAVISNKSLSLSTFFFDSRTSLEKKCAEEIVNWSREPELSTARGSGLSGGLGPVNVRQFPGSGHEEKGCTWGRPDSFEEDI